MKTTKEPVFVGAIVIAFVAATNVRADNLAAAAAKASSEVNRPVAASPHALEAFPWLLRGLPSPAREINTAIKPGEGPNAGTYQHDRAAQAAKASALVKRPIAASPHALENFPWLLRGLPQPAREMPTTGELAHTTNYPNNLAAAAAQASALVNRPIDASPHGLEEFPWILRGLSPPPQARHLSPGH